MTVVVGYTVSDTQKKRTARPLRIIIAKPHDRQTPTLREQAYHVVCALAAAVQYTLGIRLVHQLPSLAEFVYRQVLLELQTSQLCHDAEQTSSRQPSNLHRQTATSTRPPAYSAVDTNIQGGPKNCTHLSQDAHELYWQTTK